MDGRPLQRRPQTQPELRGGKNRLQDHEREGNRTDTGADGAGRSGVATSCPANGQDGSPVRSIPPLKHLQGYEALGY